MYGTESNCSVLIAGSENYSNSLGSPPLINLSKNIIFLIKKGHFIPNLNTSFPNSFKGLDPDPEPDPG